jgi:hypothetical protein
MAGALLLRPPVAQAGIEACGDVFIEAEAECELVLPGADCEVQCTPISVQASCAARLTAECSGECDLDASIECTGTCQADCEAECIVDPGDFECSGSCQADCQGSCESTCDGDGRCEASCEASCSASCEARCEGVPPSATCDARCEASCEGSCEAEANLDCQIECQVDGYAGCEVDVQGECEAACDVREGALFCDGQFIDHGDNLIECIDALRDLLDIRVEGYVNGECDDGSCEGEAGGSISCGVGGRADGASALLLIGLAVASASIRRRRGARR